MKRGNEHRDEPDRETDNGNVTDSRIEHRRKRGRVEIRTDTARSERSRVDSVDASAEQATRRAANSRNKKKSHELTEWLKRKKEENICWQASPATRPDEGDNESHYAKSHQFAAKLAKVAVPCTTSDQIKSFLADIRKESKMKLLALVEQQMQCRCTYDVDLVSTKEDLERALRSNFDFIKAKNGSGLVLTDGFSIADQIKTMGNGSCPAYRPAAPTEEGSHTMMVDMKIIRRIHLEGSAQPEDRGNNCLDLINRSGHTFRPLQINGVDLVKQIKDKLHSGRVDRNEDSVDHWDEWMLLTHATAISPFHVDAGGYCTVVVGISGTKYWYWVRGEWERKSLKIERREPYDVDHEKGVACTVLKEGDFIIQAPGNLHAVVTPTDSLVAGYFFYTAAHFPRTIECVRKGLAKKLNSNDDLSVKDFKKLSLIVRNISNESIKEIIAPMSIPDTWVQVRELLEQEGRIRYNDALEFWEKKAVPASKKNSNLQKSQKEFLDVCSDWWWGEKERMELRERAMSATAESC